MFDKPNASHTIGLELEQSLLRGARLTISKGKPALEGIFEYPATQEGHSNVNPLYIESTADSLAQLENDNLILTTLAPHEVLVRPLDLNLTKDRDIDAVISFQAEPLLPYPVENAVVDWIKITQSKEEGTHVTLVAARKDHIIQHLEKWHQLKVEPEVISCVPAALAAFAHHFSETTQIPMLVFHVGETTTTCILVNEEGKLIAAQSCPYGAGVLLQAFAKDQQIEPAHARETFTGVDFAAVEAQPHLAETLERFKHEVARFAYAMAKQVKGIDVSHVLLTGEGASLTNLGNVLFLNLHKILIAPLHRTEFALSTSELQKYAVSIGMALTALPKSQGQVNFRQQEFAYPHPWKRFKKPVFIYFALSIAVAIAFYLFGQVYLSYQEDDIKQKYVSLLSFLNKPYAAFEGEYTTKFPSESSHGEDAITPPIKLTEQDLLGRLQYLEKEIQATPDTYPLLPNVPRVSDVLAWLSTHDVVLGAEDNEKGGENAYPSSLQLDSFAYTYVKRPEITKRQEKYQVKVDIEFTAPTPKQAREFHDALIAPNELVDPKGEVKWSSNRGKFRTSFYLKDKTIYPSSGGS